MRYWTIKDTQVLCAYLIGLHEDKVYPLIAGAIVNDELERTDSLTYRVVERDGQTFPKSNDAKMWRINLTIDNSIVVGAEAG